MKVGGDFDISISLTMLENVAENLEKEDFISRRQPTKGKEVVEFQVDYR